MIIGVVVVVLAVAGVFSSGKATDVAHADGACGSRTSATVYSWLQPYIVKACFDNGTGSGSGEQLTLTTKGTWACRYVYDWCKTFASFVYYNQNWKGNRPLWSLEREIFWHSYWFKTNPIHNEYWCGDLKSWERPFYGC